MLAPKHKENIIVGIKKANKFNWYVLPITIAILDLSKLKENTLNFYMSHASFKNMRQDCISLNNEKETKEYMQTIKPFMVFSEQLSNMLAHASKGKGNFANDFCPSLLYDFDNKKMYYSSEMFETHKKCLPNNWTFSASNFLDLIPSKHQFWKLI